MSYLYYNLTTPQANIWNLQKFYENTSIQNICGAVLYNELLDRKLLEQAINEEIRLQSGLRLRFIEESGTPVQYIEEYSHLEIEFAVFDSEDDLNRYAEDFAAEPFSLIDSQMYRFVRFELNGCSGVLVCASHLISDAWTFGIMARDVYNIYQQLALNEPVDLPERSYIDYIETEQEYLNSTRYSKDEAFWKEKCTNILEPGSIKIQQIPVTTPAAKRFTKRLNAAETSAVNSFCAKNEVSQAVLFEAGVITYLHKLNQENKTITIGIPTLNRNNSAEKNTIGMFISTLPLTVEISNEDTVAMLCDKITDCHSKIFRHQKYPYSHILESLREKSNFSGNPYDVMVSYQNAKTNINGKTRWFPNGYSETPFVMHIDNRDSIDRYTLTVDYQTELFGQEGEISLLVDRILLIVRQMISDNTVKIRDLSILPEREYQHIIYDFNDTAVDYPRGKCIHELFSEQAERNSDKISLIFENKEFTYKQLDEMSNSLAYFLREKGIKPNDVVPIIAKRDWRIIVAMLGILKAGGAYMPVDPSYPVDRVEYMLETAKSQIVLTYGYLDQLSIETVDLTDFNFSISTTKIDNVNTSNDLCYIIFTSGSTGKPKGVALRHSNVANYCNNSDNNNVCQKITKSGYESIVSVTNTVFDIFVTESLLPLVNGLTIYFANDEQVFSQQKLSELFSNSQIEVMQTTPTKMRSYIIDKKNVMYLSQLKVLILGGEALPVDLYEELKKYTSAKIFNIYGPAETTVWSTNKLVKSADITIGKPIANTQVYILDKNRKPLPIGVAGELCISGDGVGAGYLNRPELTAEKFIPNPFMEGKTMYCTGDLARWREDGEIEYLGRIDTQVKIRGLRIELGEIESVMSIYAGIQLAAVTDKLDENGRQYLVGYYTADGEINEKALRAHLAAKLPKYMIPNYFMRLDEMPMTASGKTDRKNLPVPQMTASADECVAPQNELESALLEIVTEILETDQIGVTGDFFDFGGDSLRAIEYVAKAHNEGIEFTLQSVFDYPTVRELCGFIENGEERKALYSAGDFEKFREILDRNVIDENFVPIRKSLGNVLLTGATGFLGAHILDSLMKNENGKIYCLVRSRNQDDRRGRLREILNYYFGDTYDNEIGKRIIPIIGNVEQIGLSNNIPHDVQTVIHTAATVKHYGSYEYFRNVNVLGTENVVAYAKMCGARLIHISTISVSGNSLADEIEVYRSAKEKNFDETSLYIGQPLENVYIHSKFEAEIAVLNAVLDGLDAKIVRVGNLTNRQSDFKFQPNYRENAFLTRVKAALDLGLFPDYLLPLYSEFSPIDATADGVVKIAQYAEKQNVFHLNSNKPIYFDKLLDVLHKLNIRMKTVSGKEFNNTLQQLAKASKTEYIYEAFQNDMDENGQFVYDSNIRIINEFTVWFMKKAGFEWKQTDFDYIKGYIEYFRGLGYLEV